MRKRNATFSLSKEAIEMVSEMYVQLFKRTGNGSRSAVVEKLIREAYEHDPAPERESNAND